MQNFNCNKLNKLFNIDGIEEIEVDDTPISNHYYNSMSSHPEIGRAISEAKTGMTSTFKGKKHRPESIAQMIRNLPDRKGEKNIRAKTWKIEFSNGNVIEIKSLETWAKENGYKATSIRNLYNGRGIKQHKDIISVISL
jgi:hypothetical protein